MQVAKTSSGVEPGPVPKGVLQVAKTSPGVEVNRVPEPIVLAGPYSLGVDVDLIESQLQEPLVESSPGACDCPFCGAQHGLFTDKDCLDRCVIRCLHCNYSRFKNYPGAIRTLAQESVLESKFGRIVCPPPAQEPIVSVAENAPGVEVDPVENLLPDCVVCFGDGYIEDEFGCVKFCQCKPKLSRQKTQSAIVPAAKNLPGSRSKASTAHQLLELFKSSAHILEDSPGVKTEATVSESAIAPAAKNRIEEGSDQNPILTGIPLSDRFVTRYTPPQPKIIHFQSDADGQLSLLDFEVESVEEPPDPDDFESLDAFLEAIARWDWEHPTSSFDHCSDLLPSSVHSEPRSVQNELPLQVSLDSFCLWAHCSGDWYEPAVLLEPSKVLELSPVQKTSSTSDFFIPTFGHWGDRFNGSDEPPDTGIFARLPGPKPPEFPPQGASQAPVNQVSRNYPKTIPKLFHRVVAGSSTQPARSPPGGDAGF